MTTSGTTNFNLSIGGDGIVIEAFERIGVRPTELLYNHLQSASRSINLAFQDWANRGVNLWKIDLISVPLIQGTAVYSLPSDTVQLRDLYVRLNPSSSQPTDRLLYPLSRNDYAAIPNKNSQGTVNSYWFDRLSPTPTITFWLVPATTGNQTIQIYRSAQIQDANLANGETPDIPLRFLEACCADLAARLAQKFQPTLWAQMKVDAKMAWDAAAAEDRERVPLYIAGDVHSYWDA
jgi:hypothetical protein